jgi:hypothetical protein
MQEKTLSEELSDRGPEKRLAVRVNLFMTAALRASGVETPVKIRDLSASGAQIESDVLPGVGSPMTLSRGSLSVGGHVTWRAQRRCGVHFTSLISVKEWMANPANREQHRVDSIVAAVKAGVVPLVPPEIHHEATSGRFAEDLTSVSQLLELLGDALANDPAVIAEHGLRLQSLDIAIQTLTALAQVLKADAKADPSSIARLDELRTSCAEALRDAG